MKFVKPFFFVVCSSFLLFMIFKEVVRYTKNEDASSIAFKKFNSSPRDKYPTFSLCFQGSKGDTIFNLTVCNDLDNECPYRKAIIGKRDMTKEDIRSLPDFSSATIKLKEMVQEFSTIGEDSKTTNKWSLSKKNSAPSKTNLLLPSANVSTWPFYASYQNPDKICFTRNATFQKGEIKLKDILKLNSKILDELQGSGELLLYVHYPTHIIRSFGEEVALLLLTKKSGDLSKTLRIKVSGVNVIRKRTDAGIPCNPDVEDQDTYFREAVIKQIGCVPPYWKSFTTSITNISLLECESRMQLREAYLSSRNATLRYELLNSDIGTPCTEMTVSSSIETKTKRQELTLVFHYRAKNYMETINTRAYAPEHLLSSMGGFIGMFLGFGLFQMPEIISAFFQSLARMTRRKVRDELIYK